MHLLIIDTSATLRRIVRSVLERGGYMNLLEAGSLEEAQTHLAESSIQLILIGNEMDGFSGTGFTRRLRRIPRFRSVPVIMISNRSTTPDVWEAAECGIDGYVLLPFRNDFLLEKVENLLEQPAHLPALATALPTRSTPPAAPPVPPPPFQVHRLYQAAPAGLQKAG